MKIRTVLTAAAAIAFSHAALADVVTYFDGTGASRSGAFFSGPPPVTYAADQFAAANPDFSQVSIGLAATDPTDGGSVLIYLVNDVSGIPAANASGILLATIADAGLPSDPTMLTTINFSPSAVASLGNTTGEYWLAAEFVAGTATQTAFISSGADDAGTGMAGQLTTFGASASAPVLDGANGAYDMVVDTPEPASIALLGFGFGAMGYIRRRRATKQA